MTIAKTHRTRLCERKHAALAALSTRYLDFILRLNCMWDSELLRIDPSSNTVLESPANRATEILL